MSSRSVSLFPHSCSSSPRSLHTRRARRHRRRRRFMKRSSSPRRGVKRPSRRSARRLPSLNRDEIEQRHALSTIDLLRTIPGMVAVRSGGVGNLTSVFVRGGESTYNKVLLDGMPLNEPGGAFNFASLSPENIERIEVLRGAHSALFGSDAMASVIQLFSVRPEAGRPQVHVTVDGGNFNTAHLAAGVRRATGCLRVLALRVAAADGQSRAEQRKQDVDGVRQRAPLAGLGRVSRGFSAEASSDGPERQARRPSGAPTWTRTSVTATAAFSADGISRSARA